MDSEIRLGLERARRRIETEPGLWSLTQLADEARISPYHFHRMFRSLFGETPLQTATRKRLDKVIRLLRETDDSILSVCQDAGYESPTTFAAWFSNHVGCTPKEFRRFCRDAQDPRGNQKVGERRLSIAMKAKISSVTVFVDDQDESLAFYTDKLGFEVAADVRTPDGFRWLTVAPPESDVQLVLFPTGEAGGMPEELTSALKTVMSSGYCGPCVFEVEDCAGLHRELVEKGVRVIHEPREEAYGVQAMYADNSGNALCFVQI